MSFKLHFLPPSARSGKAPKKTSLFFIFLGLLTVLLLSYLLYTPQRKTIVQNDLQVGDIVKEDITVQKDIEMEDKARTEENRKQAIDNVIPIYEYYSRNQSNSQELIIRWFDIIRDARKEYIRARKLPPGFKEQIAGEFGMDLSENELKTILDSAFFFKVDVNRLLEFIKSLYDKKILLSLTGARVSKTGTLKLLTKSNESEILNVTGLYDLKKVETVLLQFIKEQPFTTRSPGFIVSILMNFIDVNISYSQTLTRDEQQRVASTVNPSMINLKAGKVIMRKGDEVKAENLKLLTLIASAEEIREKTLSSFFLILMILGLLAIFGGTFFKVWQSGSINREKIFVVIAATLTVSAVVYRICLFLFPLIIKNLTFEINYDTQSIFFAIPFALGALAVAFIFNLQSAVIFSFANAIIGGIICDWDFRIVLYILLGNLAASYGIEFYQRLKRSPIIKASIIWMLPVNIITIIIFNLTETHSTLAHISVDMTMGFISAIIAPILATFIIPLWETIFSLVTELKLIELTNLNLPIFREMLEKAPGTYHHSQMVASLAETAAQDLGLSPLLLTAMALYHDIGKIDNPHFFTENHSLYRNPHDSLSPRDSAKNIVTHIPDGMERAEKLKLPEVVSSSIRQHHGTKLVRFFYDKAREMSSVDSDGFEDKVFRYQGDKPKTIENAIIMLADQVEAASKSLASPSDEEIQNVIRKIINANVDEDQFDECEGLTFKALNSIANSFHKKLSSIYHMRISYPGFDFKSKEEKDKGIKK